MAVARGSQGSAFDWVKQTILQGILVILPITIGVLVIAKLGDLMKRFLAPVAHLIPSWIPFDNLLALVITLLVCLVVGLVNGTSWGGGAIAWFEERVMGLIPGYRTMRMIIHSFFGRAESTGWAPALIKPDETWQPGFVVERHADGQFTVFVPGAPTPTSGDIHIVDADRVQLLPVRHMRIVRSLSRFGDGVEELKKSAVPSTTGQTAGRDS